MIPVGSQPILWHIMKWYASWGHNGVHPLPRLPRGRRQASTSSQYNEALGERLRASRAANVELLGSDMDDWRITFLDTGVAVVDRRSARDGATAPRRRRRVPLHVRRRPDRRPARRDDRPARGERQDRASSCPCALGSATTSSTRTTTGPSARSTRWNPPNVRINGGFFVLRTKIFDELQPGEDIMDEAARLARRGRA